MRRVGLALVLLIAAASVASALSYAALEQVTIDNTSGGVGFTGSKITPAGKPMATQAICRLRTAEISYTYDGTVPTTSVGQLWEPNEEKIINGHDVLVLFKAIRTGATSGQLDCVYVSP